MSQDSRGAPLLSAPPDFSPDAASARGILCSEIGMNGSRRYLALVMAVAAALLAPPTALAAGIVPPGNSAVNQYTQTIPTSRGNKEVRRGGHGSPSKALGQKATKKLQKQGKDGRSTAELAAAGPAATAAQPAMAVARPPTPARPAGPATPAPEVLAASAARRRSPPPTTASPASTRSWARSPAPRPPATSVSCCRWRSSRPRSGAPPTSGATGERPPELEELKSIPRRPLAQASSAL